MPQKGYEHIFLSRSHSPRPFFDTPLHLAQESRRRPVGAARHGLELGPLAPGLGALSSHGDRLLLLGEPLLPRFDRGRRSERSKLLLPRSRSHQWQRHANRRLHRMAWSTCDSNGRRVGPVPLNPRVWRRTVGLKGGPRRGPHVGGRLTGGARHFRPFGHGDFGFGCVFVQAKACSKRVSEANDCCVSTVLF